MEERTEEDRIIEIIKIEGGLRIFEDSDFLPIRQSLYEIEDIPGSYDEEISHTITWHRPQEFSRNPQYFSEDFTHPTVVMGSLPNDAFLGALMAVCSYPDYDLLENIFASRPEDFIDYGIYTCRFYVDGDWVEVITDTRLPCKRDENTGYMIPAYSRSTNSNDLWIPLVEKAFAKAVGCYESIIKIRPHEALLHLTGGSIQEINLHEHHDPSITKKMAENNIWKVFKAFFDQDKLVMVQADSKKNIQALDEENEEKAKKLEKASTSEDVLELAGKLNDLETTDDASNVVEEDPGELEDPDTNEFELFLPGKMYSILSYKEIGPHHLGLS